ncbi:MAG: M24 family metallopeptidase [Nitrospira sp.]|nr:M24 family metallopeptidase [Nitrospira sp.]MDH4303495.1 M24 family metallopeptidase [Nitrospira sp.]MDH5192861.1 M24 family metallopeptidase [Nitrospira sp.]
MNQTAHHMRIRAIQTALLDQETVDGWLFYDFRGSDPLAYQVLLLDRSRHVTRRWYYWIPRTGEPVKLLHRIEPHVLDELPGHTHLYVSWEQQRTALDSLLRGRRHIAMQYSPLNAVPYLSRVDAGTIELIRSFGVDVVTSADLVQRFEAVWTEAQLESHRYAVTTLRRIVDEAFTHVTSCLTHQRPLTEYGLQQFILSRIHDTDMTTSSSPIAAVDAHSADPHYSPSESDSSPITRDSLVLIDLWAKQTAPGSVYGDITWTGYTGQRVPSKHGLIFQHVRQGRDAAVSFVQTQLAAARFPYGWEVDDVCRDKIREAGYGDFFIHRTGHSIGEEVHGNGANIDNLETHDERQILPHTCFSIEPGIYLPGEFGIRSELDVYVTDHEAIVHGLPLQTEVVALL